jgi:hypothetical protein
MAKIFESDTSLDLRIKKTSLLFTKENIVISSSKDLNCFGAECQNST